MQCTKKHYFEIWIDFLPFVQAYSRNEIVHYVYLKLATTDKHVQSEIIQLSAICGDQSFVKSTLPRGSIKSDATSRHRFRKSEGRLTRLRSYTEKNGVTLQDEIPCEKAQDVFSEFVYWIDGLKRGSGDKVRLISHGMHNFHARVLVNK